MSATITDREVVVLECECPKDKIVPLREQTKYLREKTNAVLSDILQDEKSKGGNKTEPEIIDEDEVPIQL